MNRVHKTIAIVVVALSTSVASADFESPWFTIAAGGGTGSDGLPAGFEHTSTIGQHVVGESMTGGGFESVGGFLAPLGAPGCVCPADLTGDGERNGADIGGFVDCLLASGTSCSCAELDGNGVLDMVDVGLFVDMLLNVSPCP